MIGHRHAHRRRVLVVRVTIDLRGHIVEVKARRGIEADAPDAKRHLRAVHRVACESRESQVNIAHCQTDDTPINRSMRRGEGECHTPPTVSVVLNLYSAGTAGGFTKCHSDAPVRTMGEEGDHTAGVPGDTVPEPDAVPTTVPEGSITATVKEKEEEEDALVHTSTEGTMLAVPEGEPSADHVMGPETAEGTYTPQGAM